MEYNGRLLASAARRKNRLSRLNTVNLQFPECPRWREDLLWVKDQLSGKIYAVDGPRLRGARQKLHTAGRSDPQ